MLRTKQISTLSKSARSFLISGSRCSTYDESSSCACSEDETRLSRNKQESNEVPNPHKASALASKSPTIVVAQHSGDSVGACVSIVSGDVRTSQEYLVHSSALVGNFVKASIATAGFLSDLLNFKFPTSDGIGASFTPQNCMVDSSRTVSVVKSPHPKPHKVEKFSQVHGKPSVEIGGGSKAKTQYHDTKGKAEKYGSVKSLDHTSAKATTNSAHSDTQGRELPIKQRSKNNSNRFHAKSKSNGQTSETKVMGGIRSVENFQKPIRSMRMPTETAPFAKLERFHHVLRQLKWGPMAEQTLKNLNCPLDAYQANQILKQLQDHTVALGFFYWLKRQAGFKHDGHSYTTMVGILGRAKQFGAINRLLDEMVSDGCLPNVVTYNRLIHCYGRANYLDDAIKVFYRMQEAGCEPDRVTYCTLIDIHAKAGFLDVAMDIYQRMQEAGLSPDTFTYSVIINCLGKAGYLTSSYKLFCEMISQGCVPNLVTYNIMIALQAKARNYPAALKLYRDMQTAGFQPDKVTYSIVMEVLGHCGYLYEAEAVFAEMKQKNWVPDEHVYGLLVDLWGKSGDFDKARAWYQAMLEAGLRPNVPTCNSLLSAFLRVHRFSDAYDVLQSMLGLGLRPSLHTYTLLLSCCTDTRSHLDLSFCCKLMSITDHPAHAFLVTLPAAGPDGQNVRDHASNFLDLMHSEDRESKRGLVDSVIDFLHKSGLKEEAGSVWEVAAQRNVYPDAVREKSSSYWLINLHVMSDGTAVTALSRTLAWFRREMLVSGIGPSRIDIVTGWGRRSKVMGTSLVRQSVQELLNIFGFPFYTDNGNSGCFVGCGKSLNSWLHHSFVERMHLL